MKQTIQDRLGDYTFQLIREGYEPCEAMEATRLIMDGVVRDMMPHIKKHANHVHISFTIH